MNDILIFLAGLVLGAITGVAVYRNNVNMFAPFADKMDKKFDELETKLKAEIEKRK